MANKFIHKIKTTLASWRIKDYIRQLSIVVLGIIITFVGSDILSTFNQQREVANTLQLVKSELLQNKELALRIIKTYAGINEASDNCKSYNNTKRNLQSNLSKNTLLKQDPLSRCGTSC